MFIKKVSSKNLERVRTINNLALNNTNNTTTSPSINNSNNTLSNMMLVSRHNPQVATTTNTTNHYHHQQLMTHKPLKSTTTKQRTAKILEHPDIPSYILAMQKNSQLVQKEKEIHSSLFRNSSTAILQTGYSSNAFESGESNGIPNSYSTSSSYMMNYTSSSQMNTTTSKNISNNSHERNSIKRFISHSQTHSLIQKKDLVLINVDEDLTILNMVDPLLHGQIGIITEMRGDDECVLEIVEKPDNQNDEGDELSSTTNSSFSNNFFQMNQNYQSESSSSARVSPFAGVRKEAGMHTQKQTQRRKRIVVPMFCLCLEDAVLKERLAKFRANQNEMDFYPFQR